MNDSNVFAQGEKARRGEKGQGMLGEDGNPETNRHGSLEWSVYISSLTRNWFSGNLPSEAIL
jgi:hypothetical protein